MSGNIPADLYMTNAFNNLKAELKKRGVTPASVSGMNQGSSEIFPASWVCSRCGYYLTGSLRSKDCPLCGSEMRQFPFLVICNNCGYLGEVRENNCPRCGSANRGMLWYKRGDLTTIHMVCKDCQRKVLRETGVNCPSIKDVKGSGSWRECITCTLRPKPCDKERFRNGIEIFSDVEFWKGKCPECSENKRLTPAAASGVVSPAFLHTFDKDIPSIIEGAIDKATEVFQRKGVPFSPIEKTFAIMDVYLAEIMTIPCTYGYRIGKYSEVIPFSDGTVYLQGDRATASVFEFDPTRLPRETEKKYSILHAAGHAFLQTAGYVTGLGDVYRAHIDDKNNTVMIFCNEAGGCDVLVREPVKMINWLRRARAIVYGCKNNCKNGCGWCLYIRNWQCPEFNTKLDRRGLEKVWERRFLFGGRYE